MRLFGREFGREMATEQKLLTVNAGGALNFFNTWLQGRAIFGKGESVVLEANSAVAVCLRWTMDNISCAPVITQEWNGTSWSTDIKNPVTQLLKRPNKTMTGEQLDMARACSLILDGNAYVLKVLNANGTIAELQFLPHYAVLPIADPENIGTVLYYEYASLNGTKAIPPELIIHTRRGIDPNNPLRGFSALRACIEEVVTDNEATIYTMSVLRNIGIQGLVISPTGDNLISEEQAEVVKAKVKASTTGKNRGEPIVSGGSIKIDSNALSPEQMTLDKIRMIPEARILGAIGIPGMTVGMASADGMRTFSNYGESRISSFVDFLAPIYRHLDSSAAQSLIPDFGLDPDLYRVSRDITNVSALADAISERVTNEYIAGIRKRSEARQAIGLPTDVSDDIYSLDAQTAQLNTDQAKNLVKLDLITNRLPRRALNNATPESA